jgi:hypothetical protein
MDCVAVTAELTVSVAPVPADPANALVADGVPAGIANGEPVVDVAVSAAWSVQLDDALIEPPERLMVDELAEAVRVPPQVLDVFGVEATVTLVGNVMESATPESAEVLGFVSVR